MMGTTPEGLHRLDDSVEVMLEEKRLVLVLDLDHTLLHAVEEHDLTPGEIYLLDPQHQDTSATTGGGEGGGARGSSKLLFFNKMKEGMPGVVTKLRPFVHTFLQQASSMFHLCICTMANRTYARTMARLLDPDGVYFSSDDIISRSELKGRRKVLDAFRRGDTRTTIILDDNFQFWPKHKENIIPMPEYHYFAHCNTPWLKFKGQSLAEQRIDEDETTGALATVLDLLRLVHGRFFSSISSDPGRAPATDDRDVRHILQDVVDTPCIRMLRASSIVPKMLSVCYNRNGKGSVPTITS